MTSLRKAAEMALEALEPEAMISWLDNFKNARETLRQALAQDSLRELSEIDHELGLYIDTPEQNKEWVGLTDEEIGWIWHNSPPNSHEYARAIEAKLKEKNFG